MALFQRKSAGRPSFDSVAIAEIPVLYRVAKRIMRNDADAEDAVGQTLLAATKAWNNFDGRHCRSWLITILRNECAAIGRKRGSRPEVTIEDTAEPVAEDFWQAVEWSLVGDQLMAALDELPEDYRLPIALCDIEELGYEEAADALQIPVGTLKSRIFRGRKLLRARLISLQPH
jgi:RNA polymerase sigma-70 factor (ECF subfamily)